jgi:hypothetical protein
MEIGKILREGDEQITLAKELLDDVSSDTFVEEMGNALQLIRETFCFFNGYIAGIESQREGEQ